MLLAFLIKSALLLIKSLANFFRLLKKPASYIGKFLLKLLVLPLYEQIIKAKIKLKNRASHPLGKIVALLNNRYLIHIIVILMALGVTTSNLLAYESRENYGQNSLINNIAGNSEEDMMEEVTTAEDFKVFSYLGTNSQLANELFTEPTEENQTDLNDQYTANLVSGETALVKPEVLSSDNFQSGKKGIIQYTVEEGNTVYSLASKFGISVNTILWANNLSLNSLIKPGQVLLIPPVSGVVHKVVRGDTIGKIAQKYDADGEKIKSANGIESDTALIAGETIIVPGGRIIYTTKPQVTVRTPQSSGYANQVPITNVPTVAANVGEGMYWPNDCHRISQYYRGWRHTGVDIACPWGVPIRAADAGKVIRVQYGRTGYGYNVIIDHGNGKQTLYGHLSKIDVENGQYVEKGEKIGNEGSTGRSTGPHLHFEVRIGGTQVNPLSYIR